MKLTHQRRRDNQQWILDWIVKESGMVQNFSSDRRVLPSAVKSYAMVPKVTGRQARHEEEMAQAAEKAGHIETAVELYRIAVRSYHTAQHSIFQDDNKLKIHYHGKLLECYGKVIELSNHPAERVEVPWEGVEIQCNLHLLPDGRKGPCAIYIPGMDQTKEAPDERPFLSRGFHLISMDGPGQGTSNMRKIRGTHDNYERAVGAVLDYLEARPEIDADRIVILGISMGSHWGTRAIAHNRRIKAAAVAASCVGDKTGIFEQASPRFKQVWMYMAGIDDEDEFDEQLAERLTTDGCGPLIDRPYLLVTGEYDPLAPLENAEDLYESIVGPKELWVMEDSFHTPNMVVSSDSFGASGLMMAIPFMIDWLRDAINGKLGAKHARYVYIPMDRGAGPYTPPVEGRISQTP